MIEKKEKNNEWKKEWLNEEKKSMEESETDHNFLEGN